VKITLETAEQVEPHFCRSIKFDCHPPDLHRRLQTMLVLLPFVESFMLPDYLFPCRSAADAVTIIRLDNETSKTKNKQPVKRTHSLTSPALTLSHTHTHTHTHHDTCCRQNKREAFGFFFHTRSSDTFRFTNSNCRTDFSFNARFQAHTRINPKRDFPIENLNCRSGRTDCEATNVCQSA
jgi:hypothetical protein